MATVKSYATTRNWCVYCPNLIIEGEAQITDPELRDPFRDPGFAHADCAVEQGWEPDEDNTDPANDVTDRREMSRQHVRDNGPIEMELQ